MSLDSVGLATVQRPPRGVACLTDPASYTDQGSTMSGRSKGRGQTKPESPHPLCPGVRKLEHFLLLFHFLSGTYNIVADVLGMQEHEPSDGQIQSGRRVSDGHRTANGNSLK